MKEYDDQEDYYWCLHCEKVYKVESWIGNDWWCPSGDCDGGGEGLDAWRWSRVTDVNPDYPKEPIEGIYYPMYK